jgi:gamma-glutamyl phosphate reductase
MKTYNEMIVMAAQMVIKDHDNGLNSSLNVRQSVPLHILSMVYEVREGAIVNDVVMCIASGGK